MSKQIELNVIAAADAQMGIGKNGVLPWHIASEFEYFLRMTSKPRPGAQGESRRNVIIVGRKTWDTMGKVTTRPFPNAYNIVISRKPKEEVEGMNGDLILLCNSLSEAVTLSQTLPNIDEVWVLGGAEIYRESLESPAFNRLYLTQVHGNFDCDSHLPPLPSNLQRLANEKIGDRRVPIGVQKDESSGVTYEVVVYERKSKSI